MQVFYYSSALLVIAVVCFEVKLIAAQSSICQAKSTGVFSSVTITCGKRPATASSTTPNPLPLKIKIPENFDVTLLPENTRVLQLLSEKHGVVNERFAPLPALRRLTSVQFNYFNNDFEAPRFPLAAFLTNNKDRIQQIVLLEVKLLRLTAEDFAGFSRLQEILFQNVRVETISPTVFDQLGTLPSGAMRTGFQPELASVTVFGNKLKKLDWGFLKSVAESVKLVNFEGNEIETLSCSRPFEFQQAVSVHLGNNGLSEFPAEVYSTFSRNLTHHIALHSNIKDGFCVFSAGCECCELQSYVQWFREHDQITGQISCGDTSQRWPFDYSELRADVDLHRHCTRK